MDQEQTWQYQILEGIALHEPLEAILGKLALMLDGLLPGCRSSILVLQGQRLRVAAGPSLPSAFNEAIDNVLIGPEVGSCGSAAYLAQPVLVDDIEHDPLWRDFASLALSFNLRACWSLPILSRGKVLGTFAVYRDEPSRPGAAELDCLSRARHLASLALESDRMFHELQESEARFRTFVDQAKDSMFLHDHQSVILDVNQRACDTLQYRAEELIGAHPLMFDTEFDPAGFKDLKVRLEAGEEFLFETRHRRRDGTTFPVEVRVRPFSRHGQLCTLALVSDISERKQAEARLERQRQLQAVAQRLAGLGYFEMNLRTGELTWSEELYEICGFKSATFQPTMDDFLNCLHPEDRGLMQQAVEKAIRDSSTFRARVRTAHPDGQGRTLESNGKVECDSEGRPSYLIGACLDITQRLDTKLRLRRALEIAQLVSWTFDVHNRTIQMLEDEPHSEEDWLKRVHPEDRLAVVEAWTQTLTQGQAYDLQHRMVREEGVQWVRVCASVTRGPSGMVEKVSGVTQDITARHRLEEQLRESQKMEAIGRLAGGVAHDFNNLLTVIQGYTSLLESDPDSEAFLEAIEAIRHASDKAAALTAQLLAFSRRTSVEPKILDINLLIHRSSGLIRSILGESIDTQVSLDSMPCVVRIDPTQFEQMLLNLVVNARDAMPAGGKLQLETRRVAELVEIRVSDTGQGIEPEILSTVFEPFFTTKAFGMGTGLGLAVVHGVVTRWGGSIEVDSTPGQGTSFLVRFPFTAEELTPAPILAPQQSLEGSETILLVEDEKAVRSIVQLALEGYGYQVRAFPLARLAVDVDLDHIDLLITDVVMPEMGGVELAQILRGRRPQLPILYVSGYPNHQLDPKDTKAGREAYLQKPFTTAGLAAEVRKLLDAAPAG